MQDWTWAPTPTRSPGLIPFTFEPTLRTLPMISWPTQIGVTARSPQPPVIVCTSEPQTPQHSLSISTSLSSKTLGVNCSIVSPCANWYTCNAAAFDYLAIAKANGAWMVSSTWCSGKKITRQGKDHTFSFVKSLHFSLELIMKPSNCSGADAIVVDCSVFCFLLGELILRKGGSFVM